MNQVLKRCVYSLGSDDQVEYIAKVGGMSQTERDVFVRLHRGETDLSIQTDLNMSDSTYQTIETSVRLKLAVAVLNCIDHSMRMSMP